jgi:hypothetical protein
VADGPSSHDPSGHRRIEFRGRYGRRARALLGDAIDILGRAGIAYHLDYGTLLGVIRDGDLIPWDGDLDIGVAAADWPALEATFGAFRQRGWRVPHDNLSMFADGPGWRTGDPRRITVVSRILLPTSIGRIRLDLVAKYADGDRLWWFVDGNLCHAPAAYFTGRREIAFADRAALIPAQAEAYLSLIYGDWQTPRRDYVAHRDDGTALRLEDIDDGAIPTPDDAQQGN